MTLNDLFEAELKKLAEEDLIRLQSALTNPAAVADFADYRYKVGEIAGIRRIMDLCDEARRIVSER